MKQHVLNLTSNSRFNQQKIFQKRIIFTLISLLIITVIMVASISLPYFQNILTSNRISPIAETDFVSVGTYNDLRDAINGANVPTVIAFTADISVTDALLNIPIGKDITLLSDRVEGFWKLIGAKGFSTITVEGTLTLAGIIVTHESNQNGRGVTVTSTGTLILSGGEISGNRVFSSSISGGGVYTYGVFIATGGKISGNSANLEGGGVYVAKSGSFSMSGDVVVSNNVAVFSGGGIYNRGLFSLYSGVIVSNSAPVGGGVFVDSESSFEMSGKDAIITNNQAKSGGGVYVATKSEFVMKEGLITNNIADRSGGGVYSDADNLKMFGGEISKNKAGLNGGGVYTARVFTMTGGIIFSNLALHGGGVYVAYGYFELSSGCVISNNTAVVDGGGVYVYDDGVFTVMGGEFLGNTAGNNGGGVWVSDVNDLLAFEKLYIGAGVVFENNKAGVEYLMDPVVEPLLFAVYNKQVASLHWTDGLAFGYNNHDISHVLAAKYTVHYYKQDTVQSVAPDKVVTDKLLGSTVVEDAIDVAGYFVVSANSMLVELNHAENEVFFYYKQESSPVFYATLTYYSEGLTSGSVPIGGSYLEGSLVTVADQGNMVRAGYTFHGWDVSIAANTVVYAAGSYLILEGDTILYAVWQPIVVPTVEYVVHYYLEDTLTRVANDKVAFGTTGDSVTETAIAVTGYAAVAPTSLSGILNVTDNVFVFFYSPNVSYTVHYYLQDTTTTIIADKIVNGQTLDTFVIEHAVAVTGYTAIAPTTLTGSLNATDNVFNFYYITNSNGGGDSGDGGDGGNDGNGSGGSQTNPPVSTPAHGGEDGGDESESLSVWAVVNLVLSIAGFVLALIVVIYVLLHRKQKKQRHIEEVDMRQKRHIDHLIELAFVMGVVGVIIFLITGDISGKMILVDRWTIVFAITFTIVTVSSIFALKLEKNLYNK